MLIYLFPILWGSLVALILCAPTNYYLYLFSILLASIAMFIYSRRFYQNPKLNFILIALIPLIISYSLCSLIIFKPHEVKLINNKNLSPDKKAVIFYCNGEMEKYSPKYAGSLLKSDNFFFKPIDAFKLKQIYNSVDIKKKNSEVIMIAKDVRNSILNYKPYYFYIAFSSYFPDLTNSIQSAINDGCSDLTIINYTKDPLNEAFLPVKELKSYKVSYEITKPVYDTPGFSNAIIAKIANLNLKFSGILILDDLTATSSKIKDGLFKLGYSEKDIVISSNISKAMNQFISNKTNNILYINLKDSGGGYKSEVLLPKEFEKYIDEVKITGLNSWGYDKYLVKAVIETIKK